MMNKLNIKFHKFVQQLGEKLVHNGNIHQVSFSDDMALN